MTTYHCILIVRRLKKQTVFTDSLLASDPFRLGRDRYLNRLHISLSPRVKTDPTMPTHGREAANTPGTKASLSSSIPPISKDLGSTVSTIMRPGVENTHTSIPSHTHKKL